MAQYRVRRFPLHWILLPLLVAVVTGPALLSGDDAKPDEKALAVKQDKKKAKGRLPAYYAQVVTEEQRQKIYDIQALYAEKIEKLQAELDATTAKRDADVEAVLSPEQRDKVAKIAAESKSKKKKGGDKEKDGKGDKKAADGDKKA